MYKKIFLWVIFRIKINGIYIQIVIYCFTVFNEKSVGFSEIPHLLHLPLEGRILSLIDFRFIIRLIVVPQLPQTTSKQG